MKEGSLVLVCVLILCLVGFACESEDEGEYLDSDLITRLFPTSTSSVLAEPLETTIRQPEPELDESEGVLSSEESQGSSSSSASSSSESESSFSSVSSSSSLEEKLEDEPKPEVLAEPQDEIAFSLGAWFVLMHASGSEHQTDLFPGFGAGLTLSFLPELEAVFGLEIGFGGFETWEEAYGANKLNLLAGLRWMIVPEWLVSPYLLGGGLYSLYNEGLSSGCYQTWAGPGLFFAGGLRIGPFESFSILVEYGRTWSFVPDGQLAFGELRLGLSLDL